MANDRYDDIYDALVSTLLSVTTGNGYEITIPEVFEAFVDLAEVKRNYSCFVLRLRQLHDWAVNRQLDTVAEFEIQGFIFADANYSRSDTLQNRASIFRRNVVKALVGTNGRSDLGLEFVHGINLMDINFVWQPGDAGKTTVKFRISISYQEYAGYSTNC